MLGDLTYVVIVASALAMLLVGIIMANVITSLMVKVVNEHAEESERIPWYGGLAKWAYHYEPQSRYEALKPNGPLLSKMKVAFWLCGIGFTLGLGTTLLEKLISAKR